MIYRVEITPTAERDVREITDWYRQTSGEAAVAQKWANGFALTIDGLSIDPHRHPLAREFEQLSEVVREVHFGSGRRPIHRIIFEIREETVFVLRVWHYAQRDLTPDDLSSPSL